MRSAVIQTGLGHGKRLFDFLRRAPAGVALAAALVVAGPAHAQAGAAPATVTVKGVEYRSVKVESVSPSTVTIRHAAGLTQLLLRDLPPEWQTRLGYDPVRAAAYEKSLAAEAVRRAADEQGENVRTEQERTLRQVAGDDTAVGRALSHFGRPVTLSPIDLREKFRALELVTKDQGRRPSCSVFAVVSALEYQNALVANSAEKLSEEYVIWATRRTLGLAPGEKRKVVETGDPEGSDAGFTLGEVLSALRGYGVPLQSEMPNTFGLGMEKIAAPADEVIAAARRRRQVFTHTIPGRDNDVKIQNILQVLNEGVPVVIGLRWPHWRTLHQPLLSRQRALPGYSHAVTLVGYTVDDGRPDSLRFIFRNSWGARWGVGGYGFAERGYLLANLLEAVVVEVRPRNR